MDTNNPTATTESPETFDGLMLRFMSAANRLRLAVRDIELSEGLDMDRFHDQNKPALFVLCEAAEDLEKLRNDFCAWGYTHKHTQVQS
jgi:hypothetical protein